MIRDCTADVARNTQRAPVGNHSDVVCYEGGGDNHDSNIVTGTFLLNKYVSMLFGSGADRSFVSSTFSALLDVAPSTLDTSYAIELTDGRILETDVVLRGCTLGLLVHPFDINLMLVELGSFDIIIEMYWLAKYYTVIVCDEKIVCIPYEDEVLIILGDDCDSGKCSSSGALYNKSCGCSKGGFVDKFVRDLNKTPDSSQRPPHDCLKCGNLVDGLHCRQCALLQKKLKEVWFTICDEHKIFQDFLNTFESSNDNTNVVSASQEPFVFNQDHGENSSQSPPYIDHHCCYGCGDSLDGIFCHLCTCESCGNDAHYGYNYPPKVLIISNPEPCHNQNVDEFLQTLPSFHPTCYFGDENSFAYDSTPNFVNDSHNIFNPPPQPLTDSYEFCGNDAHYSHDYPPQELAEYINTPSWNRPAFYNYDDDDEDYTIAITPVVSTEELVDSLIIKDEHLDTIRATESNEVIKSSVEDLVSILSESEGIFDNMCDVPFRDNSLPLDILKDQFEIVSDSNDDSTLIDDDSFSIDDIDYVEASPSHFELVSLGEVKDFYPKDGEIEDDILREKFSKINLLIAKIESLNDNPTLDRVLKSPSLFPIPVEDSNSFFEKFDTSLSYSDNSLPGFETFSDHTEETSSGSTTTHVDYSLPQYDLFLFEIEPDQDELTSIVMEDNLGEPRVHVPNVLPTHPTLMLDSDFIPSDDSLPKSEIFCFDIEEKNSGSTTIHAHISLSDFDHFHFEIEPDPGELTSIVNSGIRENVPSTTNVNLSPEDDQSPLFDYVVWIFLSFLTYLVVPPYLHSSRNEDTIFDPGISIYHSFMPGVSHRSGTFMKFNVYPNHLNESPMEILSYTCSLTD
nr:putative reverse transcriptase domain-containing protein [Tanacetum cinerariifolium]